MASVTYLSRRQTRAIWPQSESNELLRLAIEVGGIGIFENDLKRKRTRLSPELCAILGLPVATEMPYEEAWGLVDERDRAAFEAAANADAMSQPGLGISGRQLTRKRPNGAWYAGSCARITQFAEYLYTDAASIGALPMVFNRYGRWALS